MTDQELLSHFQRQGDGWVTVKPFRVDGAGGGSAQVGPGNTFKKGVFLLGVEVSELLDAAAARQGI